MSASLTIVTNILGVSGINLYPLPTSPGFRTYGWAGVDTTSDNTSPYTGSSQMLGWPGADKWTCTAALPKMNAFDAGQWIGAFLNLRGRLHAFQMGDQLYNGPQNVNAVQGSVPVIDDTTSVTNAPGTVLLATRGWNPNAYSIMTAGDYLQFGYRFHKVTTNANSDANGKAVLSVWPSLRVFNPGNAVSTPPDGTAIDIVTPVGLFRRSDDVLPWQGEYTKLTEFSFTCREFK